MKNMSGEREGEIGSKPPPPPTHPVSPAHTGTCSLHTTHTEIDQPGPGRRLRERGSHCAHLHIWRADKQPRIQSGEEEEGRERGAVSKQVCVLVVLSVSVSLSRLSG